VKVLIQRTPCRKVDGALPMLDAIDTGDTYKVAESLWATCYFTTHVGAPDADARVAEYAAGLERHRTIRTCPAWISFPMAGAPRWMPLPLAISRPDTVAMDGPGEGDLPFRLMLDSQSAIGAPLYCSVDPRVALPFSSP